MPNVVGLSEQLDIYSILLSACILIADHKDSSNLFSTLIKRYQTGYPSPNLYQLKVKKCYIALLFTIYLIWTWLYELLCSMAAYLCYYLGDMAGCEAVSSPFKKKCQVDIVWIVAEYSAISNTPTPYGYLRFYTKYMIYQYLEKISSKKKQNVQDLQRLCIKWWW